MSYDSNKPNRLDSIEQKLYSPKQDIQLKDRKVLREKQYDIPQDWEHTAVSVQDSELELPADGPNWFFRLFLTALVFFVGAAGFAAYMFFIVPQSINRNIDILVNAPLSVGAGEPFDFEVLVENKDASAIILADLEIQLPDGTRAVADIGSLYTKDLQTIDRIEGGTVAKRNYSALLFGEEGDIKDIKIFLTYRTEDSTAFFEKEKTFDTTLTSSPIRLVVNNVTETTSNQDVTFSLELVSNSSQILRDVVVRGSFPFGFVLKDSSLPVSEDKQSWTIPVLNPKESFAYTITGSLEGQQGDDKFFRFVTGLEIQDSTAPFVAFGTKDITIQIKRPFLELDLAIRGNNAPVIVLDPTTNHTAELTFKNNSNSPIRNAQINMLLAGSALNKSSVRVSQGFYQSLTNTITWDNTNNPNLGVVQVGANQKLSFSFNGLGLAEQFFDINPELRFTINAKGNRNPENNVIDTLEDTVTQIIRFNTETTIETKSEYFSSIFTNVGPIPPRAEERTTYTGIVQVLNTSNQVQNATVTLKVPNYIQYQGVYSPSDQNVSYDSVTRTITWNIGTLPPLTGYKGNPPKRLYLQASIVPSVSQSGQSPELFNSITFSGVDVFTQTQINKSIPSITTVISDAKDFQSSRVVR